MMLLTGRLSKGGMVDPATLATWIVKVPVWAWKVVSWPLRSSYGHVKSYCEFLRWRRRQPTTVLDGIAGQFITGLTGNQAHPGLQATMLFEEFRGVDGDRTLIRRIENELGGYRSEDHLQESLPTFPRRTGPFGVYVYRRQLSSPIPHGTLEPTFRAYLLAPVSTIEVYLRESEGEYVWFDGRHLLPIEEVDREEKRKSDMHQTAAMDSLGEPRDARPYPIPIGEIRELTMQWFTCIRNANERLREYRRRHES